MAGSGSSWRSNQTKRSRRCRPLMGTVEDSQVEIAVQAVCGHCAPGQLQSLCGERLRADLSFATALLIE